MVFFGNVKAEDTSDRLVAVPALDHEVFGKVVGVTVSGIPATFLSREGIQSIWYVRLPVGTTFTIGLTYEK